MCLQEWEEKGDTNKFGEEFKEERSTVAMQGMHCTRGKSGIMCEW